MPDQVEEISMSNPKSGTGKTQSNPDDTEIQRTYTNVDPEFLQAAAMGEIKQDAVMDQNLKNIQNIARDRQQTTKMMQGFQNQEPRSSRMFTQMVSKKNQRTVV